MNGTKHISDLITDPSALRQGRINIIDAPVSAGKTHFALTTIPKWTTPEKILYLIDTTNGEMRIQRNIIAVNRMDYAFCDYNTKHIWGEQLSKGRMPVMTYAGFGSEVRNNSGSFKWFDYDYIICDEMQNLVDYQRFNDRSKNLEAAEDALRAIAAEGSTTIIAMSATPKKIRERFGRLCHEVEFDRSDLIKLCTSTEIPYSGTVQELLDANKGKTGILYVTEISNMKKYIDYANSIGFHANGFWSIGAKAQKDYPMTEEQYQLRECVLSDETIPENVDLLIINRASETCIKIQGSKRKVDFIIVHDKNEEIRTQVRGRYHGDLDTFYYHSIEDANRYAVESKSAEIAPFLNKRLYADNQIELCHILNLKKANGGFYGMPTVSKYLRECGYDVSDSKKDSHNGGKYYRIITPAKDDTNLGNLL